MESIKNIYHLYFYFGRKKRLCRWIMAEMDVGLRGFIGEIVAQYRLEKKYDEQSGYAVVRQIIPEEVDKRGGGYLDFGVIYEKKLSVCLK
jgi:hypothetical protein